MKNLNNETIEISDLKYRIKYTHINDTYKCGIIGLNNLEKFDFKLNKRESFFINDLKEKEIISEYTFSILYNEKMYIFHSQIDNFCGRLIIRESPHIIEPKKIKKKI